MSIPFVRSSSSRFFRISRLYIRHLAVVGLLALFGICHGVAQSSVAPQSSRAAAAAPAATQERETAPTKDDANHQGIKVHGHWKIVVKNPDGSVAQTHEFENSLVPKGGGALASILTANVTPGPLAIGLTTSGTSICATANCVLVPNPSVSVGLALCNSAFPTNTCTAGLTTTLSGNGLESVSSGQLTATNAGTITTVSTFAGFCGPSISTTACQTATTGEGFDALTSTTVSPISVNAGQIVQVSVTISFS
jgi:hypothetical protein